MSRRGMRRKLRSVQVVRNKEVLDSVNLGVAGNTTTAVALATAVNDYAGVVGTCPLGCAIKGFEIELSDRQDLASSARRDWYINKNPGGAITFPAPGSTGGSPVRRYIIHEEKGLAADDNVGTIRQRIHINIPKRYWRMGEGDIWQLRYGTSGGAGEPYDLCIKCIYKWVM